MNNLEIDTIQPWVAKNIWDHARTSTLPFAEALEGSLTHAQINWVLYIWHTEKLRDSTWIQTFEDIINGDFSNDNYNVDANLCLWNTEMCILEMKKHKVYISGPMTGLPDYNYKRFNEIGLTLNKNGIKHFNPAKRGRQEGWIHRDYLKDDIKELCDCSAILKMRGWSQSLGAREEVRLGRLLFKMPIFYINNDNTIERSI